MMLHFEKIVPTSNQVGDLYKLLLEREYSISHTDIPSLNEHSKFVSSHPYVAWYLIYKRKNLVGSFYVNSDNSIGLNFNQSTKEYVSEIISFVKANHKPLPSVKSVRRGEFFMNVSSNNGDLIKCLQQLGKEEIQRSFVV